VLLLLCPFILSAQSADEELVNPKELIPDLVIDLRYNTNEHLFLNLPEGNLKLPKFYTTDECLFVLKGIYQLKTAQDTLRKIHMHNGKSYPGGIGIKVWDAYRPRSVQYLFWEIYPNSTYIAEPGSGSKHNRGGAIDVTLVDLASGEELAMPTAFDDFSDKAGHGYMDLPADVLANRALLYSIMTEIAGFNSYYYEWWHYEIVAANDLPLRDFQLK
jgi:D-alanyl-D-alanine dipeptidase